MKYTSDCIYYPRSDSVALVLDDLHDLRDIFLAGVMVRGFHHHAHYRLSTGLAHQNAAGIAQCFSNRLDCLLHRRVVLRSLFVGNANILQHLRVDLQRLSQLAHGHLLCQHDLHHLETGQDTITGACVLGEDDMTALLTANTAAVLGQVHSINVTVHFLMAQTMFIMEKAPCENNIAKNHIQPLSIQPRLRNTSIYSCTILSALYFCLNVSLICCNLSGLSGFCKTFKMTSANSLSSLGFSI